MDMYSYMLLGALKSITSNVDGVTMDIGGNGSTSRSEAPDMQEQSHSPKGRPLRFISPSHVRKPTSPFATSQPNSTIATTHSPQPKPLDRKSVIMNLLTPASISCFLALILAIAFLLFQPTGLVKWLQKKNYQYEVTFALYMLTPTEKFIFSTFHIPSTWPSLNRMPVLINSKRCILIRYFADSVLFLTLSMFTIAVTLYLPNHLVYAMRRGYYYFAGREAGNGTLLYAAKETVTEAVETAYRAGVQTAAAVREQLGAS